MAGERDDAYQFVPRRRYRESNSGRILGESVLCYLPIPT